MIGVKPIQNPTLLPMSSDIRHIRDGNVLDDSKTVQHTDVPFLLLSQGRLFILLYLLPRPHSAFTRACDRLLDFQQAALEWCF